MVYHVPFQRYINYVDPQIQNDIKVQISLLKILKKKWFLPYFWVLYAMERKKGKFDHRSRFAYREPYAYVI